MLSPRQIRAARGLLDWDANYLAEKAKVTPRTVSNIEAGRTQAQAGSMESIAQVLIAAGVEFTANDGVRMRPSGVEIFEGVERFQQFVEFVYEQIRTHGGDVCLSVSDERLFSKYRKNTPEYYQRMQTLSDTGVMKSFRILAHKSNFASQYTYNTYRWQPETSLAPTAFYIFAEYLALISFEHSNPPHVIVIKSAPLVNSYRIAFDAAWTLAKEPPKP